MTTERRNTESHRIDVEEVEMGLVVECLEGSDDLAVSSLVNCEQEDDSRKLGWSLAVRLHLIW